MLSQHDALAALRYMALLQSGMSHDTFALQHSSMKESTTDHSSSFAYLDVYLHFCKLVDRLVRQL